MDIAYVFFLKVYQSLLLSADSCYYLEKLILKKLFTKIWKIFILILVWSIFYFISLRLLYNDQINFRIIALDFLNLNTRAIHQSGFLWYLQSLIGIYLLLPVLSYVFIHNKRIYHYLTVIVVICSAGSAAITMIANPIAALLGMKELPKAIQAFLSVYAPLRNVSFLSFFLVGREIYLLRDRLHTLKAKKYAYLSLIASILICIAYGIATAFINPNLYSNYFVYGSIFMLIIIISLYTITQDYHQKGHPSKLVCSIGKNTLGIYLLHVFIIQILSVSGVTSFLLKTPWGIGVFCENIIILLITYLLTLALTRIPYIRKLVTL